MKYINTLKHTLILCLSVALLPLAAWAEDWTDVDPMDWLPKAAEVDAQKASSLNQLKRYLNPRRALGNNSSAGWII